MDAPRKGHRGVYQTASSNAPVGFTVIGTEGNICWVKYDHSPDVPSCFIWRFHDGPNQFHDWPGKIYPAAA